MRISLLVGLLMLGCTGGEPAAVVQCESTMLADGTTDVCDLATCEAVDESFRSVRSDNLTCSDNTDCIVTQEAWFTSCDCGSVTNTDAEPDISALRDRWNAMSCNDQAPEPSDCDCWPNDLAECGDDGVCVGVSSAE